VRPKMRRTKRRKDLVSPKICKRFTPTAGGGVMRGMRGLGFVMVAMATLGVLVGGLAFASAPALAAEYKNLCKEATPPEICAGGTFKEPVGVAVDNSSGVTKGDVYVAS
jgi:hypothetical protein